MRLVLALEPAVEDAMLEQALRAGHEVVARAADAGELAAVLPGLRPDVALVTASPRMLRPAALAAADDGGVRLVCLAGGRDQHSYAAALGLHEVLDAGSAWPMVEAALTGRAPLSEAPRPRARGRVVAVWGPVGAPGRTTTAIALAAELALAGQRVILVDGDTHGAAIAPSLGLLDEAPGFAAACRLAGAESLDVRQLDRVAATYQWDRTAFRVLTGIARPSRWPELSSARVKATLQLCREEADVVVVDAGFNLESDEEIVSDLFAPRRNAATLTALQEADLVVAVGAADPLGLSRFLRGHVDLLELVDPESTRVLITKVRGSAVGMTPGSQIASTLLRFGGIADATLVPSDPAAYDAALLTGRTLQEAAPGSRALAALRGFAREQLLPAAAVPERPVRRRRWLPVPLS
ncbi:MAG: regulator [Naasia sp.]|uniref:AAA family ATPase n=1 Tax=Naasia sp. TaxID=2546198 RepID=UPI00261F88C6|nr:regulator [Naasia sp.]MCU1570413.1 regulator [Naasia sp.]